MKKILLILFCTLLIISCTNNQNTESSKGKKITIFQDSTKFLSDNIVLYEITFQNNSNSYLVYSFESQDGNMQIGDEFLYTDDTLNYYCLEIWDLPTGINWNLFHDLKNDKFFITDPYNLQATDDVILRGSVSFEKRVAAIKRGDVIDSVYNVKLNKLILEKK
jgi:hypothetical protein